MYEKLTFPFNFSTLCIRMLRNNQDKMILNYCTILLFDGVKFQG